MSQLTTQQGVEQSPGLAAEFLSLVSGVAVYELSNRALVVLTGTDRVRWLNGMVTNNIRDLAVGHGVYAFLLNPQGHIQADLYAYNRGDSILVNTDRALLGKVLGIFDHYIIMDDVEVADSSDKISILGVAGPRARATLAAAGFELPDLQPLQFSELKWRDQPVTITRHDNEALDTYQLQFDLANKAELWKALLDAGASPVSDSALELLRIAAGIPRYGQDIRERDLPQETEQARALHFSKGCYVGQEIVERIRSRGAVHRKFTGFEVAGPLPAPGAKIQSDGKDIGEITSVAIIPTQKGDRPVALGYMRREAAVAGKKLMCGESQVTVANLPFADAFRN
jgi:folate-binding protein YgfZ